MTHSYEVHIAPNSRIIDHISSPPQDTPGQEVFS